MCTVLHFASLSDAPEFCLGVEVGGNSHRVTFLCPTEVLSTKISRGVRAGWITWGAQRLVVVWVHGSYQASLQFAGKSVAQN